MRWRRSAPHRLLEPCATDQEYWSRRMASVVITKIADAVRERDCSFLETEVTWVSIRSSMLSRVRSSCWAAADRASTRTTINHERGGMRRRAGGSGLQGEGPTQAVLATLMQPPETSLTCRLRTRSYTHLRRIMVLL